jgi:FkbM family methyltransferase
MLRRLAELASRNIILRRKLPVSFGGGYMLITPAASLRYWKPDIYVQEKFLFDTARLLVEPGSSVWDLGANNGVFSVAAAGVAGRSGRIIAFEPDYWLANIIARTAQCLPKTYASIDVVAAAISEETGFAEFAIAERSRASNYLLRAGGSSQTGGIRSSYRTLTFSLDNFLDLEAKPNVIKIDVEGAEAMILRGAKRLLENVRPRLVCEVVEQNRAEVQSFLTQYDYRVFDGEHSLPLREVASPSYNAICIPSEDPILRDSHRFVPRTSSAL